MNMRELTYERRVDSQLGQLARRASFDSPMGQPTGDTVLRESIIIPGTRGN